VDCVCSRYGERERERCIQGFGGKIRVKETIGGPDVKGRIILKWVLKKSVWSTRSE
jgi:hypothetical protein